MPGQDPNMPQFIIPDLKKLQESFVIATKGKIKEAVPQLPAGVLGITGEYVTSEKSE